MEYHYRSQPSTSGIGQTVHMLTYMISDCNDETSDEEPTYREFGKVDVRVTPDTYRKKVLKRKLFKTVRIFQKKIFSTTTGSAK